MRFLDKENIAAIAERDEICEQPLPAKQLGGVGCVARVAPNVVGDDAGVRDVGETASGGVNIIIIFIIVVVLACVFLLGEFANSERLRL
jgi:hypothetical protein